MWLPCLCTNRCGNCLNIKWNFVITSWCPLSVGWGYSKQWLRWQNWRMWICDIIVLLAEMIASLSNNDNTMNATEHTFQFGKCWWQHSCNRWTCFIGPLNITSVMQVDLLYGISFATFSAWLLHSVQNWRSHNLNVTQLTVVNIHFLSLLGLFFQVFHYSLQFANLNNFCCRLTFVAQVSRYLGQAKFWFVYFCCLSIMEPISATPAVGIKGHLKFIEVTLIC